MAAMLGVGAKYGLTRDNFLLDPLEDFECFAREDIDINGIRDGLAVDLVTGLAPKRIVWGLYGAGKTHTLMRTTEDLQGLTPIIPFRIECPNLTKKSRFHDLYREGIMRELGQDFIVNLLEASLQRVGLARREEMVGKLKDLFESEEVSKAAIRLVDPNFDQLRLWRWISGVALSRQDLDDLGQTQDLAQTEAARLADMIIMLGRLVRETQNRTLVLVLDEMERLQSIGADTMPTFVSGFTRLLDPNQIHVSVMVGLSPEGIKRDFGEIFGAGPIASRLVEDDYIEIPPVPDEDVDAFVIRVLQFLRDPDADLDGMIEAARLAVSETVSAELFPLTREALDALKSQLMSLITPREISLKLTRALGRAYRAGSPAVTSEHTANLRNG